MAHYRLYFLSGSDGHIVRFEPIEARDDREAAWLAEAHVGARPLELWDKGRRVGSWAAVEAAGSQPQLAT